jgi:hypothetical protein
MKRHIFTRIVLTVACGLIAAMWVYAFVFAPRESINKIKDEAWTVRSQATCKIAEDVRFKLQDLSEMDPNDSTALRKKAELVDKATDALEIAINTIEKDIQQTQKVKQLFPTGLRTTASTSRTGEHLPRNCELRHDGRSFQRPRLMAFRSANASESLHARTR